MLVGKQFGPFKVEKELGSGAMGSVYRGVDEKTGKRVAIKIIAPGLANNETAIERFLRESNVLKRLSHPNIAKYLGSGRYHGTPFYIMEFIQGESLDHVLTRRLKITWEELVSIGTQLCAGLQAAHDAGIIHRDLKPSNLMIVPGGKVKLTDFGIAKDTDAAGLTATHSTLGTAAYMSPEQCRGSKDITYKSDLYSMGIMFYELVTGKKPFVSENPMEVFRLHVKGTFARPSTFAMDLPVWLDTLICQLMEKNPDDRPLNATKVAEELNSVARKISEQASAALDRAGKRRADVTANDVELDATDKEMARALLGKRRKSRKKLATRKRWFTFSALSALLIAILLVIYSVIVKTPSAEGLYRQANRLMQSEKLDDHKEAREPIETFLKYHSAHATADQMKRWRDRIEIETTAFYIRNERKSEADPKEAWDALEDEKSGRLDEARRRWVNVMTLKSSNDALSRGWGLFAEKSIGELQQVSALEKDLYARIRREVEFKDKAVEKGDADRFALGAMRSNDPRSAERFWNDLKRFAEPEPELRTYYLLALKRLREIQ